MKCHKIPALESQYYQTKFLMFQNTDMVKRYDLNDVVIKPNQL